MSLWDQKPLHTPSAPPFFEHGSLASKLFSPFIACWIAEDGMPRALSKRGCHLRKGALAVIRRHMNDGSSPETNAATRYYIWDSSWPSWEPHNPNCWTPVAQRPRDQWVPAR